jgi:hypothetical protein
MSTAAAEPTMLEQRQRTKAPDGWKLGDCAVLLAYVCVTLWTIRYHEKWADEAQAWLIARDLDLRTIWFHELRYEGSPGLWHTILWIAQHVFHAGYGALGYIGLAFGIAGTAVLLFKAPFPRIVRWPLAFTYVMVYQYAVIARPYTLLPLLAFCAAILFKDLLHPERMTVVLALLALLTLHGTILAGCLGLAYLVDAARQRQTLDQATKKKFVICAAVMACTLIFIFVILKPTSDVEEFATKGDLVRLSESLHVKQPTWGMKLVSVATGAFLDFVVPSFAFILLAGAWCAIRHKLLPFAASVAALIAFYMAIHGYSHHHGTVTIAAIVSIWIAWPLDRSKLSVFENRVLTGMIALLLVFCAVQTWDSVGVIVNEYRYPYSGAEDAANFLKSEHAEQKLIFGFVYGIAGIQAYFDHNIFANTHTAYYHHGVPLEGRNLDLGEVERVAPGYIVVFTEQPRLMLDSGVLDGLIPLGYKLAHFSDGYLLYRRGVYVRQTYLIFSRRDTARVGLPPSALAETLGHNATTVTNQR